MPDVFLDVPASNWWTHGDLADMLLRSVQPKVVVEVGVYLGSSLFLLAELARRQGIVCGFIGVDTWHGDSVWDPGRSEMRRAYRSACRLARAYPEVKLVKLPSVEASAIVPNESTELIHIDADHTYEGVLSDYRAWLPKLTTNGLMLFHDIGVIREGVGVHRFWREVSVSYPSFADTRSAGLGILAPKGIPERLHGFLRPAVKLESVRGSVPLGVWG